MLGRRAREANVEEAAGSRERPRGQLDAERRVAAWIGSSIVLQGRLTSSEDLTIAGHVKGDVEVRDNLLVIAPGGRVEGNIVALDVVVNGLVSGDIQATHGVEVGESGVVAGDITTPRMRVNEGAKLNGRLAIASGGERAAPSPEAAQSTS